MTTRAGIHQNRRRGFNLVESAIVLGVVGAVLGGIWGAATSVWYRVKSSDTISGAVIAVRKIQATISIADAIAIGGAVNINSLLIAANVYPKNWVKGGVVYSPFGSTIEVTNYVGTTPRFDFSINNFDAPRNVCIRLITEISSLQTQSVGHGYYSGIGLGLVQLGPPSSAFSIFPITPQQAEAACVPGIRAITFTFGYTRIN